MLDRLYQWNVKTDFADHWEAYAELIPKDLLIQTKAETHGVERDNFRQRHWFACFRRKACVVSRSQQMVDLTWFCMLNFGSTE
jgi:insertion element IS1 protein InsB